MASLSHAMLSGEKLPVFPGADWVTRERAQLHASCRHWVRVIPSGRFVYSKYKPNFLNRFHEQNNDQNNDQNNNQNNNQNNDQNNNSEGRKRWAGLMDV